MSKPTPAQLLRHMRPSGAKRWTSCHGSALASAHLEPDKLEDSSDYADEGTMAHELAELLLKKQITFEDAEMMYPSDMCKHVFGYVKLIEKVKGSKEPEAFSVENKVPIPYAPPGVEDEGCTPDCYLVEKKAIRIFDLKYGAGVKVEAVNNKQLAVYAIGIAAKHGVTDPKTLVSLLIYQPRYASEVTTRMWNIDLGALNEFYQKEIQRDANHLFRALSEDDPVRWEPSDSNCQFCKIAANCSKRAEFLLTGTFGAPEVPTTLEQPNGLSRDRVVAAVLAKKSIVKWLNDCEDRIYQELTDGSKDYPEFKLVSGRANRSWVDEDAAHKFLRTMFPESVCNPPKLISPAGAEALMKERNARQFKWEELEKHISRPTGKPTLALADDPRESIGAVDAKQEFEATDSLL